VLARVDTTRTAGCASVTEDLFAVLNGLGVCPYAHETPSNAHGGSAHMTGRLTRAAVVLCCAAAACAGAHGQEATQAGVARPPTDVGDEVQVVGRNAAAL